jgi:hypothetical protein
VGCWGWTFVGTPLCATSTSNILHGFMMKKILLILSGFVFLSHLSLAETRLYAAWQELRIQAFVGNDGEVRGIQGGIPATRSVLAQGSNGSATAQTSASQSGAVDNLIFSYSGRSTIDTPDSDFPSGDAQTIQGFDFDVVGQSETLTVDFSSFVTSTTANSTQPPSAAFAFFYRANGQGLFSPLTAPGTRVINVDPGQYRLLIAVAASQTTLGGQHQSVDFANTIVFSNLGIAPGAFQKIPVVPPVSGTFRSVGRREWFDPPAVDEFFFQMTSNSLFTGIFNFPTGFSNSFEVLTEGQSLGSFTSDESVNFVELLGHGVASFRVRNITPKVDASDPKAFPIQLDFDTETADFVMIPNPGVILSQDNDNFIAHFAGVLEQSTNLTSWGDVQGSPPSPLLVPKSSAPSRLFFRAHLETTPPPKPPGGQSLRYASQRGKPK